MPVLWFSELVPSKPSHPPSSSRIHNCPNRSTIFCNSIRCSASVASNPRIIFSGARLRNVSFPSWHSFDEIAFCKSLDLFLQPRLLRFRVHHVRISNANIKMRRRTHRSTRLLQRLTRDRSTHSRLQVAKSHPTRLAPCYGLTPRCSKIQPEVSFFGSSFISARIVLSDVITSCIWEKMFTASTIFPLAHSSAAQGTDPAQSTSHPPLAAIGATTPPSKTA